MKQQRVEAARRTKSKDPEVVDDLVVEEPEADLLGDVDDLLDEIDAVLEDQSALLDFRQRSGQ
jgi:hypothetical protein